MGRQPPYTHERLDAEKLVAQMLQHMPIDACLRLVGHLQDVLRERVAVMSSARGEPKYRGNGSAEGD